MRVLKIFKRKRIHLASFIIVLLCVGFSQSSDAQFRANWLSAGSYHNWYSEIGMEIEHGLRNVQQFGKRWPGIYPYQDMQAARALWIGVKDYTDNRGDRWDRKVVHVGPRGSGGGVFFPIDFTAISRFEVPVIFVDGDLQFSESPMEVDEVDPTIDADVMIRTIVNTEIGLTMERRIKQFSVEGHDNYHILEYIFTNTGNVNDDPNIELPNQTLEDVVIFFQSRLSAVRETRYLIGNHTGWGRNTMNDARGVPGIDPDDVTFRAQFSWHGYDPTKTVPYDNIGAPIWYRDSAGFIAVADTIGRLGAPHFGGVVTIHADRGPNDPSNDPAQPSTTSYVGSDDRLNSGNDPYNPTRMREEYDLMTAGHRATRHAYAVEPSGNFAVQRANPNLGTSGGFSYANGYGPYTLGPGESIRLVVAEGVSGLSRDEAIRVGRLFKDGAINDAAKNEMVLTGRDSLFQTFQRAIDNFESGYAIPRPPLPPSVVEVNSGGDRITVSWEPHPDAGDIKAYRIYRATERYDSTYYLVHEASPAERSFDDREPIRGLQYFYYIVSVADAPAGTPPEIAPGGELISSRYWTQTYDPAFLRRAPGERMDEIRVVPNPYSIAQDRTVRYDIQDRLAFLNVPGECTIKIYTEIGELIETIEHTDGSGDAFWDLTTSSRQVVVSGVYIAVIENHETGDRAMRKFVVIR